MKRIEMTVSVVRKVNLGNYESADVFCALKAEPESGDGDTAVLLATLFDEAKAAVEAARPESEREYRARVNVP